MTISAVDVHLLDLPLIEPFVASHGRTDVRTIVMVSVTDEDGAVGWGECSALPAATYTAESAAGAFATLTGGLAAVVLDRPASVGTAVELPALAARCTPAQPIEAQPMATAAVEMAVLDLALAADGMSLATWLGVDRTAVPAGVSIGLGAVTETVATARRQADLGYGRIKVKIEPGHDIEVVGALRRALPAVELQVDANGAYRSADLDHLCRLVELGVDVLEQPLAVTEVSATAELIERLAAIGPIPVVADEAVSSLADARELIDRRAMTGLSIKPPRVGGIDAARHLLDLCGEWDIAATAGGMLEVGLGRHSLAAVAALDGFTITGDLSPASRWLAADPWPDLVLADGKITVPTGPGVAGQPDPEVLADHTVDQWRLTADERRGHQHPPAGTLGWDGCDDHGPA